MKNSVIACVVMSSFVLDQMAAMSLGSSPHYDRTQVRRLPVRSPRLLLRAAESLLDARHSPKKEKGKGWVCFRSQHVNPEAQVLTDPSSSERCMLAIGL